MNRSGVILRLGSMCPFAKAAAKCPHYADMDRFVNVQYEGGRESPFDQSAFGTRSRIT